ncbi:MAG TPA: DNA polymerase ligase N-terminal domain-containing protein [Gemmatimonadales bacterium]|jgi:bifunctional non-homologous end joining protein LigD|nr:DNA polymerase ligase N-terminal domain-containing protein [Gemmatimonadales bacterium]
MGLKEYRKKRDFAITAEPAGKLPRGRLQRSFVIQHHFASREHYDFRLELDGVLKSWAVPKGPSKVPGERRLAVEVEDHPLEYASFEGTIPEGQYGAGEVLIWDRGSWDTESDPREALKKGSLDFVLSGKKLKGAWTLVRMRDDKGSEKHNWLLIKRSERPAVVRGRAK